MASLKAGVDRIVRTLEADHGCRVRLSRGGHWMVTRPGCQPVTISRQSPDPRALRNIRRDLRVHLGVDLSK